MKIVNEFSAAGFEAVTHCIFDMDGLLLDTETLAVTQKILDEFKPGTVYTWDVKVKMLGLQKEDVAKMMVEIYDLPLTGEKYSQLAQEHAAVIMKNCHLMPGAERLVRHLHSNNVPICLATSSSRESFVIKTSQHRKLFNLFHHRVMGSSEIKKGKPAPDIFLATAQRFPDNPKPESCLVFEDAPNGCKAARAAGMQVVMVPNQYIACKQTEDATMVINSLIDFIPELFGLPPFKVESQQV